MGRSARRKQELRRAGEMMNDPELQEKSAAAFDGECRALRDRDRLGQMRHLVEGGWSLLQPNLDGLGIWENHDRRLHLIHSISREDDGQVWAHVSVSYFGAKKMPAWDDVRSAGQLLYPDRFGIIVVAAKSGHVNIAEVAHVWYCLTADSCPDFSRGLGTILWLESIRPRSATELSRWPSMRSPRQRGTGTGSYRYLSVRPLPAKWSRR